MAELLDDLPVLMATENPIFNDRGKDYERVYRGKVDGKSFLRSQMITAKLSK